ncbi:putative transposase [Mariprofundus ferrinatatus]|uniref:Putative transposase n=1 Tax=Mariprofundus ferrinatatus TaxID=1921087 RepID=A0A2K8L6B7_9PROT|nr:IS200/IS605 family transposase [Mariprofundus ferrinatatus]ATX81799.1 putative transposase [Mariprofundus ferrinatatus]
MVDILFSRNCVYQIAYHAVWCPKYRHDVLVGDVAAGAERILDAICQDRGWSVIAKEIQPDHIHLFLTIPPAVAVADAIKILKGASARKLFTEFPELKQRLWGGSLWSPSYYVGTAGNVSAETIRHYIERTEHVTKRR